MSGDVKVQNSSPAVRNDEETVKHAEGERRHSEEVHRGDGFAMVAQKCRPAFGRLRISRSFLHPTQHGFLRNIEAKHLQFSVNPRRASGRVFGNHAEDEFAQFPADTSSSHAGAMPREPRRMQIETCPMPANNGVRLN
jgi:hypothetical protein